MTSERIRLAAAGTVLMIGTLILLALRAHEWQPPLLMVGLAPFGALAAFIMERRRPPAAAQRPRRRQ